MPGLVKSMLQSGYNVIRRGNRNVYVPFRKGGARREEKINVKDRKTMKLHKKVKSVKSQKVKTHKKKKVSSKKK